MKFPGQSARFKTDFLRHAGAVLLACLATCALAEPPAGPVPESTWRVVITGFFHPQNAKTQPITGAKDAKFAAARVATVEGGAVTFLSKEEFAALEIDWATFSAKTAAAASAELAKIQPELIRDRNQVIECAILRAKAPADDITSAILAPGFLKHFTPFFGCKILLAIPDKQTVFLFPKLASHYQEYGDRVLSIYHKSECPVSREVFELSATGLRAIGEYTEP